MNYENLDAKPLRICDMSEQDKPREKAIKSGVKSLTDCELMAIIFGTGLRGKSVIQLSKEILASNGNHLSKVARLSVAELLQRYKGIGPAKAVSLLAALEVGSRAAADAAAVNDPIVRCAADAVAIMRPHMDRLPQEEFWIMLLSRSARVIKTANVSRGGVASTIVDVKIVMKHAIESLANTIILFHNHPSGNVMPSAEDDKLTRKIQEAARLLDITVSDHIILTDSSYYSYLDSSRL